MSKIELPNNALAAFEKARDEAMMNFDLDWFYKLLKLQGMPMPSSKEVAIVSLHQARVEITSLPSPIRRQSLLWLKRNGYTRYKGLPWPEGHRLPE